MQNNFINRGRQEIEYAGFWVRLAAYCIDSVIVWAGLLFVKLAMGIFSISGGGMLETHLLFRYSVRDIILYVFEVLYFILLTYGTGTTPGKRLLNLRVVNADLSPGLSLVDVVYRETVGRFLCGLSVGIGYIMAGVDREKRGLHDMICDTRVVYAKKIKVMPKYEPPRYEPLVPAPPGPRPGPGPGSGPIPMPPYGGPPQGKAPGPDGRYAGPPQSGGPGSDGRYAGPPQGKVPGPDGRYAGPPQTSPQEKVGMQDQSGVREDQSELKD